MMGSGISLIHTVAVVELIVPKSDIPFSNNITLTLLEQPEGVVTITSTSLLSVIDKL